MRTYRMQGLGGRGVSLVASGLAHIVAPVLAAAHSVGSSSLGGGMATYKRSNFHPLINRHTGKPHEHKREIARRLRQAGAA